MSRAETTSLVGMLIALGAWSMAFLALLFAYADMRLSAAAWPPAGEPRAPLLLPSVNSMVIILSSFSLERWRRVGRRGWLTATLTLGVVFLALQTVVWRRLWLAGLRPGSGRYGSTFYSLTALHALHVAAGLVGLTLLLHAAPARPSVVSEANESEEVPSPWRGRARNWTLFWHFVGAVWLVLFVAVYLT